MKKKGTLSTKKSLPVTHKGKTSEKHSTSWGTVASWYEELLEDGSGSYQSELILPNLSRFLGNLNGKKVLDLACGQGFFSRALAQAGGVVVGVDISKELIALAKGKDTPNVTYVVSKASALGMLKDQSIDLVVCILALQNIKEVQETFKEVARVLKKDGTFCFVLNHPAFRIPQASSWEWDIKRGIQYRRIERYLGESESAILMHPGEENSPTTVSFHRPLQYYIKAMEKAGFVLTHLEEWNSHKKSQKGPRQKAEDTARKEIPLFLFIEVRKA